MCAIAVGLALFWGVVLEASKKKIFDALPSTSWWQTNALYPTKAMMSSFGYPKHPTDKFPNAVTEPMARDFFAFLVAICSQHFVSALCMLPILVYGWEDSSDSLKSLFVLGTISDFGFDLYDSYNSSVRTFSKKHTNPLPIDFWIIIVAMHHTLALSLMLPMNLNYVNRYEYHQTACSLLMAAALCYGLGCYKFTLDIAKKNSDFLLYKLLVVVQLGIILYTRVYLWFPAASSFRAHVKEQDDTAFFYGASFMIGVFSLFNVILVVDGVKAVAKCVPKKFPKSKLERESSVKEFQQATAALDFPGVAPLSAVTKMLAKRKFKGAVHSVIAAQRMESSMSGTSGRGKDD